MILSADIHKAVNDVWNARLLDNPFTSLWSDPSLASEFPVLHDQEAGPGQPFPYCVFEQSAGLITDRMSDDKTTKWEIRNIPWVFRVHARSLSGQTAKEVATSLIDRIAREFGGHPVATPELDMVLDNGNFLLTQYVNDFGVRDGDDEYQWTLEYLFRVDVPIGV
jgi:hypothetical protein